MKNQQYKVSRFSWCIDNLAHYRPRGWPGKQAALSDALSKFGNKRYHDEHDTYEPFEKLLKQHFSYKGAVTRITKQNQYLRNKKPKSLTIDEHPDFTFGLDENTFVEFKNREDLDKQKGKRSPHRQALDYLENCSVKATLILCNLEKVRFYVKHSSRNILVSEDYEFSEIASNGLPIILYSILGGDSAIFGVQNFERLLRFISTSSSNTLTTSVVAELVDTYQRMIRTAKRDEEQLLRLLLCRIAFIFVAESRELIPKGTSEKILTDLGWKLSSIAQYFKVFNGGSSKYSIPKFNGRLFHTKSERLPNSSATRELYDCIKRISEMVRDSDAFINDEVPGSILESLFDADHQAEKVKLSQVCTDAQKRITDRMNKGVFYTGKLISELAAESLLGGATYELTPALLDLCAGSGSLLISVVKKLSIHHSSQFGGSYYESLKEIIDSNLYIVDKDPTAIELIRLNMAIETARFGTPLVDSSSRIVLGDALTTTGIPSNAMELCISNPPYLAWEKVQSETSEVDGESIRRNSILFNKESKPDLWFFFLEKALNCTKLGGRVAFVVSDTWVHSERGRAIRKLFENTVTLEKLIHFGYPLFPGSSSCPSIIVLRNEPPAENHTAIVESYCGDGKRETVAAIEKGQPLKSWGIGQGELNKWLDHTIPFADEMTAARSRRETEQLPKLIELGLEVYENRLQGKPIRVRSSKGSDGVPVMAGRGFGSYMGYVSAGSIPKDWDYIGKPAILIHRKGAFIETRVVSECPVIWEGVTVIGCSKHIPVSVLKKLDQFLHSDYFREWYMMRYSTTWTQGGYIFFKVGVQQYPCPRKVAREILHYTKKLPATLKAA